VMALSTLGEIAVIAYADFYKLILAIRDVQH
jgi:hypothetical protein